MKNLKFPFVLMMLTASALVTLGTGCGGSEYAAIGTAKSPGTDAKIEVEEIEGGNLMVNTTVTNLPPADRLQPGATVFVVWFVGNGKAPLVAGSLAYDADERQGTLSATTPLRQFEVRITAESSNTVASPSDAKIISQKISED